MKTELKSCPLCGMEAYVHYLADRWFVVCPKITHTVRVMRRTKRAAIAAWNRRAKNA